jgi:hypothetical protein
VSEFTERYRKAISQNNAIKRTQKGKHRKKTKWHGKYLGVVKQPPKRKENENE